MNQISHMPKLTNLPLTSFQKRLWIIYQQDKKNPAYNIQLTYHLKGEINHTLFQESIAILFNRHHTMFSVFKQKNDNPYCEIIPRLTKVELIDYSLNDSESSKKNIFSFISEDSRKHFDIELGPLYRLYLLKQDEKNYFFHATIHHIIFDGWSRRIFVNELSLIYSNFIFQNNYELEPLKFHSYDYAKLGNKSEYNKDEINLIEFWRKNLNDSPPELKIPLDFPRKHNPTGFGKREHVKISSTHTSKLKEFSKEEDTTLFNTLLSILGILFQKYSGENDICIGIPVSSRQVYPDLDKIFGLFVNTTVVRLKIKNNDTFRKYIHYARDVVKNAIAHSKLPFEKIVEAVNPDRVSNIHPIFQVSLSWLNDLTIPMNLGGIQGERISIKEGISPFDITFYLWENGDIIEGEIEYNIDILKQETIIRLRDNFYTLLRNLIENPDANFISLPVISEKEKELILSFTETRTNYPKDKTIVQLFEEQVDLYPDKQAVGFKQKSLTYRQLHEKTNQLARTLENLGVNRESPVGLLVEKSTDMIVGILGILKAGGGYVPIDPEYPKQRIKFMIKDAGCRFLLTQKELMDISLDKTITKLNLNSPSSYNSDNSNIEWINSSSDLAYIMYTSGTTGVPKGSLIQQYNVVRLVRNTNYIELKPDDRILLTGAIVFDATTFEIWSALLNGGSLYIAEKETILDPRALGEALLKNRITILWLTSPLFTQLAEARTDIFAKLKYLFVGGDVLSARHINKVRKDNPQLKVINGYGPTENTTFSTTYLIEKDFDQNIPIGKPISNTTAYIFDEHMNYQPIGVIGELYLGGDGLSKGYLNRNDLNRSSFKEHPYNRGERLYRTGDRARWLADGNIEFHGRIDNQLKIRGFRVELEEVESAISEIEGIIETIIKPIDIEKGDVRLVAFLNVSDTLKLDIREIRRRTREKLPPHMVPSAFKLMHGFPKTNSGKIKRKALGFDINEFESREIKKIESLSPTEKIILDIWCDALKTRDISTTDNFFEIGGNSLLAISVFSKIESFFNIELGLRVFFDSPRISDLAENIDIIKHKTIENKSDDKKEQTDSKIIKGEI